MKQYIKTQALGKGIDVQSPPIPLGILVPQRAILAAVVDDAGDAPES